MSVRSFSISERGLVILIGAALLATGVIFFATRELQSPVPHCGPIVLENVHVIRPTFLDEHKIDLNTATLEALTGLPGIGEALAGRIIAYRETHGRFETLDGLIDVHGIGPHLLETLQDLVTVEREASLSPD